MTHLSRREFLRSSGIAVLVGAVSRVPLALGFPQVDHVYGRALSVVDVYALPQATAEVKGRLWPDSVNLIEETVQGWYRIANGYAKRSNIQPMVITPSSQTVPALPFWAEVSGAVALIRRWCAADAPLVARIGHGGVAQVVDRLSGDTHNWYALADEDTFLGWSPASPWTPVNDPEIPATNAQLHLNLANRELDVVENERLIMRAPMALGTSITSGAYTIHQCKRSVMLSVDNPSNGYSVPWNIRFGDYALAGAYWHNQFGEQNLVPGPAVQVAPAVARWLYANLPAGTDVIVR